MIREWRLGQFKSVGYLQSFPMRPLTVFAGPNSSGKSSVLQSILLISQTLASKVTKRQLVLNGELLKLGTFEDVRSHACAIDEVNLGFSLDIEPLGPPTISERSPRRRYYPYYGGRFHRGTVTVSLTFGPSGSDDTDSVAKFKTFQARLIAATFVAEIRREGPRGGEADRLATATLQIRKRSADEVAEELDRLGQAAAQGSRLDSALLEYAAELAPPAAVPDRRTRVPGIFSLESKTQLISVNLDHFLPSFLITSVPAALNQLSTCFDEVANVPTARVKGLLEIWAQSPERVRTLFAHEVAEYAKSEDKPPGAVIAELATHFRDPGGASDKSALTGIVARVMSGLEKAERTRREIEPADLPDALAITCAAVAEHFAALRYLGPLRDDPKPVYGIASSADPSDVGVKGEFTAAVLDLYAGHLVDFVPPGAPQTEVKKIALHDAVHAWLQHFEMADSFATSEEGKLGHRLMVRPDGVSRDLDLTNVGVGVSQVLPILVMSLISDAGATLLFEQPELHLHPKVQSLLGDFFLAVIRTGRQCVIETHSEYLINRLRLRAAEAPWDLPLHDQLMLYFVERYGDASEFRHVRINEYGAIPDWPRGFFDQGPTESERILSAGFRKRDSRRTSRK